MKGQKEFWERSLLGPKRFKHCVYHCIVPLRLYDYYSGEQCPPETTDPAVLEAFKYKHTCAACARPFAQCEPMNVGIRFVISREGRRFLVFPCNCYICDACAQVETPVAKRALCHISETSFFSFLDQIELVCIRVVTENMNKPISNREIIREIVSLAVDNCPESQQLIRESIKQVCNWCGKFGVKLDWCGRCKLFCYCSTKCQNADWYSTHKVYCRQWRGAGENIDWARGQVSLE